MKKFAVFGCPVSHSLSPQIHQQFAQQFAIEMVYVKKESTLESFKTDVLRFFEQGGTGLNITLPFKELAFAICDQPSVHVAKCGAANTLWMNEGMLCGQNTDGIGLVNDLESAAGFRLKQKRILIIGCGGATRGVLTPLVEAGVREICLTNRTPEKAVELAKEYARACKTNSFVFENLRDEVFDLVINASSSSVHGQLPLLHQENVKNAFCYDMFYNAAPTVFLQWCKTQGAYECRDGLGMLVGQAAESFNIWNGCRPDVSAVLDVMRQSLK